MLLAWLWYVRTQFYRSSVHVAAFKPKGRYWKHHINWSGYYTRFIWAHPSQQQLFSLFIRSFNAQTCFHITSHQSVISVFNSWSDGTQMMSASKQSKQQSSFRCFPYLAESLAISSLLLELTAEPESHELATSAPQHDCDLCHQSFDQPFLCWPAHGK